MFIVKSLTWWVSSFYMLILGCSTTCFRPPKFSSVFTDQGVKYLVKVTRKVMGYSAMRGNDLSVTSTWTLGHPHTQDATPPVGMGLGEPRYVDQSCFNDPVKWIKVWVSEPCTAREFTEEIHDYGEYCKYQHVDQAMKKAYPWNKQTLVTMAKTEIIYPKNVNEFHIR